MTKSKLFSASSWRGYLIQLSIVIVGIVVTFVGSDLISRWSRQRQVRTVMQLVVSELETNRKDLQWVCNRMIHDRHGMLLFKEYNYDIDAMPYDTLAYYGGKRHIIGSSSALTVRQDAVEVLKSSGVIAYVGDKHLLMEVLGCYNELTAFGKIIDYYNDDKNTAIESYSRGMNLKNVTDDVRESWKQLLTDPLCLSFIENHDFFIGDDEYIQSKVTDVDETIALIKQKYRFE